MIEPTYTIKPLVWVVRENGDEFARLLTMRLRVEKKPDCWQWSACVTSGLDAAVIDAAWEPTKEAAKLAAESAYRRLLAEHLVEVK